MEDRLASNYAVCASRYKRNKGSHRTLLVSKWMPRRPSTPSRQMSSSRHTKREPNRLPRGTRSLMTSESFVPLTELERDALAELSNIAMAKAANSLRKMIQHEVLLAVPSVDILTSVAAANLVAKPDNPKLVAVRQDFAGPFSGRALLIFPEANSLELVRAVVGRATGARRHRGSGRRSAGGNRQYHSQQLGRDDRKPSEERIENVASNRHSRRRQTHVRERNLNPCAVFAYQVRDSSKANWWLCRAC